VYDADVYCLKHIVNRILILPLVLTLSGLPAVAVVCDLMLCSDRAESAGESGCHDHPAQQSGSRVISHSDSCTHLSQPDPYLASISRLLVQLVASTSAERMPPAAVVPLRSVDRSLAHGPPGAVRVTPSLSLRI
jgi:hypothetical protein